MNDPVHKQLTKTTPTQHPGQAQELLVDHVGERLGNYRLVQFLERGGFADVYLGEHVHLSIQAAVKLLRTQLNPGDLSRFQNEARIIARLRHSHIVSVLDFDVQHDIPFLVMDYAPNGSLRQRHPRGSILSFQLIASYLSQVAEALDYAHARHFIHRDVKPENMLLSWHDEILLSDFGIAVVLLNSRAEMQHEIFGTVAYMAPEQFNGQALPASDQYALGIVVYEWLCGDWPFHGTQGEVAAQHMSAEPPSLRTRNPQISQELERVVLKALAKEPGQRYTTVGEFARAFVAACPQQGVVITAPANPVIDVNHYALTLEAAQKRSLLEQSSREQQSCSRRTLLLSLGGLLMLGGAASGIAMLPHMYPLWLLRPRPTIQSGHRQKLTRGQQPGTLVYLYHGHVNNVRAVAWSPDGLYIASGSDDQTVRVWESRTGADQKSYTGHEDSINCVAWSPDGRQIASGSSDKTVQVWAALKDSNMVVYTSHNDIVHAVSWSPTAAGLAYSIASGGNDDMVRIWRSDTGSDIGVFTKHTDRVRAVAWSPRGKYIASAGDDQTVQVWEPGDLDGNIAPDVTYTHHKDSVRTVAWSPDGKYVASAGADATVQVWYGLRGDDPLITYSGHNAVINALAWSPDGQRIASASDDGTVQVWNARSGKQELSYHGHSINAINAVYGISWSPQGKLIASASADKTVQIWYA